MSDLRSTLGENMSKLSKICQMEKRELTANNIKQTLTYFPQFEDRWHSNLAKELLDWREGKLEIGGFTQQELEEILNYRCTS